ncbi:MAG: hypothetical protein JWP08_3817 [Bryobacterales bacterium]|nr:hypothetical protein [Bryobacterales bacterium]
MVGAVAVLAFSFDLDLGKTDDVIRIRLSIGQYGRKSGKKRAGNGSLAYRKRLRKWSRSEDALTPANPTGAPNSYRTWRRRSAETGANQAVQRRRQLGDRATRLSFGFLNSIRSG